MSGNNLWTYDCESISNYPRPQGNLPASEYMYKKEYSPNTMYILNKPGAAGTLISDGMKGLASYIKKTT